jgi:hypothetical protein
MMPVLCASGSSATVADQPSRVIAEAASAALSPLGLVRKGGSRTWLDDQSWWLGIAEFKPSNQKPGAYLNVGLMFLWHPADRYIFEIGGQAEGFSPADSIDFAQAVQAKAERAARDIATLRAGFRSADDVIRYYAPVSGRTSIYGQVNLATALALAGSMDHCRRALDRAVRQRDRAPARMKDAFAWVPAAREAAEDSSSFRSWVMAATHQTRQCLGLPDEFALPQVPDGPGRYLA